MNLTASDIETILSGIGSFILLLCALWFVFCRRDDVNLYELPTEFTLHVDLDVYHHYPANKEEDNE